MINEIYTEALLAAAAYADWGENSLEVDRKAELINKRGFTDAQYKTLFDPATGIYEVIPNGYTSDSNGFSATVFREKATGKLTVSFRGTDGLFDWDTNIAVVLGIDIPSFTNTQDDNISKFLYNAGLLTGTGELQSGVNFTGHSLGGYLATMASYKYVDTLGSTSTFNGLGTSLTTVFNQSVLAGISLDGKVINYYADFVGANVGFHPGLKTEIFIENEDPVDDHSISKLVQSLSVYRVLNRIDPSLSQSKIYSILDSANNVGAQSLSKTIDKLGDLLGGSLADRTNKNDIERFYQGVDAKVTSLGNALSLVDVSSLSGSAQLDTIEGQAYRYALVNLNTFAISGPASLYTAQADELKADNFTEQYLRDRAYLLTNLLVVNQADSHYVNRDSREYFRDVAQDKEFITATTPPIFTTPAADMERYYFDNDLSHGIEGGDQNDHLYGGGGDLLFGGAGNNCQLGQLGGIKPPTHPIRQISL